MKYVIISHHPCQDGFMAATICRSHLLEIDILPEQITWVPGKYKEPPPAVDKETFVYVLDFSYLPEVMCQLAEQAYHVVWIDHHASAIKDWDDYTNGIPVPGIEPVLARENEASGAMLTWRFFNGRKLPPLVVAAVDDRDRWQFKLPKTKEITAYGFSLPFVFSEFDTWLRYGYAEVLHMVAAGAALMRKRTLDCYELVEATLRQFKMPWAEGKLIPGELRLLTANAPDFMASDLAEQITARTVGHGIILIYAIHRNDVKFSVRSAGKPDLQRWPEYHAGNFAKKYGGGGHVEAAGFTMSLAQARAEFPFLWE